MSRTSWPRRVVMVLALTAGAGIGLRAWHRKRQQHDGHVQSSIGAPGAPTAHRTKADATRLSPEEREAVAGQYQVVQSGVREPFAIVLRRDVLWLEPPRERPAELVELGRGVAMRALQPRCTTQPYSIVLGIESTPGFRLALDVKCGDVTGGSFRDESGTFQVIRLRREAPTHGE